MLAAQRFMLLPALVHDGDVPWLVSTHQGHRKEGGVAACTKQSDMLLPRVVPPGDTWDLLLKI